VRTILGLLLISAAALFLACGADKNRVTDNESPPQSFQNLTQREHVLNNLEVSYNKRNFAEFDKLLDGDFTFFFSPGDVGGNIPEQWGRAEEVTVASLLLDPALNQPPYPTCRSIRMDLRFEGGVAWHDTIPPAFPSETWSTTKVYYEFTFEMNPDQTYIAVPGSQAQLTVRNVGTDDAPKWRLVEWKDLATSSVATQSPAATEKTTWGQIKTLYR
jgi:hypothetical protein